MGYVLILVFASYYNGTPAITTIQYALRGECEAAREGLLKNFDANARISAYCIKGDK